MLVVNLIVENLLLIPQSVVQGENLGYKRLGTSTLIVLLGGAATIGAAEAGLGLVGVAAALVAHHGDDRPAVPARRPPPRHLVRGGRGRRAAWCGRS